MLSRRGLITGLISLVAAPAIVRFESIMPVRVMPLMLVRHPLYDSDEYQRLRENYYGRADPNIKLPWREHWRVVADHFLPPPRKVWDTSHTVRYDGL